MADRATNIATVKALFLFHPGAYPKPLLSYEGKTHEKPTVSSLGSQLPGVCSQRMLEI